VRISELLRHKKSEEAIVPLRTETEKMEEKSSCEMFKQDLDSMVGGTFPTDTTSDSTEDSNQNPETEPTNESSNEKTVND